MAKFDAVRAAAGHRLSEAHLDAEPTEGAECLFRQTFGKSREDARSSLDEEDARALSRFVVAVLGEKAAGLATPEPAEAELLWLPFSSDGYALVEPLTGAAVPHRLLDA